MRHIDDVILLVVLCVIAIIILLKIGDVFPFLNKPIKLINKENTTKGNNMFKWLAKQIAYWDAAKYEAKIRLESEQAQLAIVDLWKKWCLNWPSYPTRKLTLAESMALFISAAMDGLNRGFPNLAPANEDIKLGLIVSAIEKSGTHSQKDIINAIIDLGVITNQYKD